MRDVDRCYCCNKFFSENSVPTNCDKCGRCNRKGCLIKCIKVDCKSPAKSEHICLKCKSEVRTMNSSDSELEQENSTGDRKKSKDDIMKKLEEISKQCSETNKTLNTYQLVWDSYMDKVKDIEESIKFQEADITDLKKSDADKAVMMKWSKKTRNSRE